MVIAFLKFLIIRIYFYTTNLFIFCNVDMRKILDFLIKEILHFGFEFFYESIVDNSLPCLQFNKASFLKNDQIFIFT
jgi:hypothetical protein